MRIPIARLGRRGETRAVWHYRLRGYRILERNLRLRGGEIDLVVRRGRSVAFVEVKTRQQRHAGEGFEAVDRRKESRLSDLADRYLATHDLRDCEIRFDVVSLFWTGRRFQLRCYRDAFRPQSDRHYPWRLAGSRR